MDERARELCNLLLREGSLRRNDDTHAQIYAELMGDPLLYDELTRRLATVGYDLVQQLGHLGVRVAGDVEDLTALRNNIGLDAAHIRLIVYLWVRLVYQEWLLLRREVQAGVGDAAQTDFFEAEQTSTPWLSYRAILGDFEQSMRKTHLEGVLRRLQRERFIRVDRRHDRVEADASLYVLVDRVRMEDFVVGLARRVGREDPVEAVSMVATGSQVAEARGEEDSP